MTFFMRLDTDSNTSSMTYLVPDPVRGSDA